MSVFDATAFFAGLSAAFLLGTGALAARAGMMRSSPAVHNFVGALVGVPVLLGAFFWSEQWGAVTRLNVGVLGDLAGVALCSQVGGSLLIYDSMRFTRASQRVGVFAAAIVASVLLAEASLGESPSPQVTFGISVIVISIAVLSMGRLGGPERGIRLGRGAVEALGGAVLLGLGAVFIRTASMGLGAPALGSLMSDLMALPFLISVVYFDTKGLKYTGLDGRTWRVLILSGVFAALGSYSLFVALALAPVYFAVPLAYSAPFFTVAFSSVTMGGSTDHRGLALAGLLALLGGAVILFPI